MASPGLPGIRLWHRLALLVLLLAATTVVPGSPAAAGDRQRASIVLDHATGEVLHAEEPDAPVFPASLTKMMTLYMVFDALDAGRIGLDTRLKVSERAAGMPPTKLGLRAGSTIRVEDAVMSLVTKSANDMASTIAENLGGSEARFAEGMTRTARRLGMARTTFRNASGLPDAEQRTTARDLAKLASRVIADHPRRYRYFARQRFTYAGRTLGNHNRLLAKYAGMDGIKTGYTNASGFNLASSAVRGGRRIVAVVAGGDSAGSRDAYMVKLLDRGFARLEKGRPAPAPAVPLPAPVPALPEVEVAALAVEEVPDPAGSEGAEPEVAGRDAAGPDVAGPDVAAAEAVRAPAPLIKPAPAVVAAAQAAEPAVARLVPAAAAARRPAGKAAPAGKTAATAAASARSAAGRKAAPARAVTYAVLVGTHGNNAEARRAAQLAVRRAPTVLRGTFVSVNSVRQGRKPMFRAQLVGLDRQEAETACKQLKKHKQACEIVRTGPVAVALN